jgi:hypothetical protein
MGFIFGIISGIFLISAVSGDWTHNGLNTPQMPYLYALLPFGIIILLFTFFIFIIPYFTTHKMETPLFIATIFLLGLLAFIICFVGTIHAVAAGTKGVGSAGPIGITGAIFAMLAALMYQPLQTIKKNITTYFFKRTGG